MAPILTSFSRSVVSDQCSTSFGKANLAQPPGPEEIDALKRAEEVLPMETGKLRVAVPRALAKALLAEVEPLPEALAGATWAGLIRGQIARAGGEAVHVHESGRA